MNAQAKLNTELEKWAWLRHHLEAENFDGVALLSALESETNITECLLEIGEEVVQTETLAEVARERAKQMKERASRLEDRAERLRRIITATMINNQIDKPIQGPTMTLFKRNGGRGVIITDIKKIPKEYFDDADPKLNKRRLREAMDLLGKTVEGAQLENGGASVTILTR